MTKRIRNACKVRAFTDAVNTGESNANDVFTGQRFFSCNNMGPCVGVVLVVIVRCETRSRLNVDLKSSSGEFLHARWDDSDASFPFWLFWNTEFHAFTC